MGNKDFKYSDKYNGTCIPCEFRKKRKIHGIGEVSYCGQKWAPKTHVLIINMKSNKKPRWCPLEKE